ncbi:putative alcohol dehydrogenase GroES-like domain [Lyophyllum shimeji]|uniref:Alcohol dehydrogenase GroES-like domain n=1 Tax=Lyophyllum shimeji TaxID=47721 RepID=A0A9P3PSC7_LYOSH|nr:putative alcohol dehydrogenase GroES-like domain [Lyophyllum shimeji]
MQLRTLLFASIAILLTAIIYSMSGSAQQALLLESKQGKFVVGSRPIPKPGPGEILVKLRATALNPVDWKIQKYGIFITEFPAVLGTDGAGEVEQVGEGVTNFSKGDRVFFQGTFDNDRATFQQYTIAAAATASKIPSNLSFEAASTIPVAFTAAYVGLYNHQPYGLELAWPLESADRVIQLARLSGFSPIITTASSKHADYLKSLGATNVLDRSLSLESLQAEIKKLTNTPVDIVFDAISSKETQQTGHDLLVPGGHLVTVLPLAITKSEKIGHVGVQGILRLPQNQELLRALYSNFTQLLEEKAIIPNRFVVLSDGLHGIIGGLQRLENNQVSGVKLVARPRGA